MSNVGRVRSCCIVIPFRGSVRAVDSGNPRRGLWGRPFISQPPFGAIVGVPALTNATTPARIAGGRSAHAANTAANSGSVGVAGGVGGGVGGPKPAPLLPDLLPPESETSVFPDENCDSSDPIGVIPTSCTEQHRVARLCRIATYAIRASSGCGLVRASSAACSVAFCGAAHGRSSGEVSPRLIGGAMVS